MDIEILVKVAAYTGGGLAMGLGAIGAAIGEGYTAAQANLAVSRDPKNSGEIFKNMLVGQAVAESASIFALVIAILLLFLDVPVPTLLKAAALFGAGISMGLAAIGSGYGGGLAAGASCEGIARQPKTAANVTTIILVGQAVSQTPSIFGLLVSFILMFKSFPESTALSASMALLGAGICTGFGGIGPGIGNGMTAEGAVRWVARNVEHAGDLMRIMLVGQAVSQSTAIYAMVVSLVLIFVV